MGLYGGLKQEDIHRRKSLKKSQKILDHMGSTELAANLFRATQAGGEVAPGRGKGEGRRKPDASCSRREGASNHPGTGRHDARKIAGGRKHQED